MGKIIPPVLNTWQIAGQSSAAVSCGADTNEDTLATITIPANALGANGRLRITTIWTTTNSGNNKTTRVRYSGASGTQYGLNVLTTTATAVEMRLIGNRNATNSQVGGMPGGTGGWGTSATAVSTSAVDTTAATTVVITGQKASSGEVLTLESYLVELLYAV